MQRHSYAAVLICRIMGSARRSMRPSVRLSVFLSVPYTGALKWKTTIVYRLSVN